MKTFLLPLFIATQGLGAESRPSRARVVAAAEILLEQFEISYAYGGAKLGDAKSCGRCNACLSGKKAPPKQQLKTCPDCLACSIDCSHFTQKVFQIAGLKAPYLTTETMRRTPGRDLLRRYRLIDLGNRLEKVQPGDLAVYPGHVVMVSAVHGSSQFDIIHATGGKDIKAAGQGIQRERRVSLENFRGPLQRLLRHRDLVWQGRTPRRVSKK